jgi:predicted ATPase
MLASTSASTASPLVGRRAELEQLDAGLDALGAGTAACIALDGEPGIGKSRLLWELRSRADARGHLVLSGSAAEFERDLPYGVWVEALDAYVASHQLEESDLVADLAVALPSARHPHDTPPPAGGDQRHRAHRAIRRLLATVAGRRPLVLVLDDLHWTDAASVELIGALLRRGLAADVLLALGYRTGRPEPSSAGAAMPRSSARAAAIPSTPSSSPAPRECRRPARPLTAWRRTPTSRGRWPPRW